MVTFPTNKIFFIASYLNSWKIQAILVEGQSINCVIECSNPPRCYFQFSAQTYFPLQGKDKFPLDEGDIFESKFPLVARIGLAACACGSGIGQSPSNSALWGGPTGPRFEPGKGGLEAGTSSTNINLAAGHLSILYLLDGRNIASLFKRKSNIEVDSTMCDSWCKNGA